ncbi:SH3 domain-containing protein [Streptomyces sp. MS1.AVA.3]|uniref:SH3 domain-containing protein n=1 Tax=Streptomyces decoyicus TaxID=249567 RepID=UPI0030BBC51C
MRARIGVLAATTAAIALPVITAPAASAAPAAHTAPASTSVAQGECDREGPWKVHAKAVKLRSKPSTKGSVLGILYKNHKFKVHSYKSGWVNVTDKNTHVRGWASMNYVYPTVYTCFP